MKMVKSHTRKKFVKKKLPPKLDNPQADQVIGQVTDYIKRWTNHELGKLQTRDRNPICIATADGYRVGLYRLHVFPNKTCDVYDHNNEFIHRFESKISAILYTVYIIKFNYWTADEILTLDTEINKNYTDVLNLRRTIERATQQKDYNIVDIRQSRLEIAQTRLEIARDRISKIHRTAKYNKVWE